MKAGFQVTGEVLKTAIVGQCYFHNDTEFLVLIIDHDGTHSLNPGETQGNYLVKGFSVDLLMKLTDNREVKINFPSSKFENRTHKMSTIFENEIKAYKLSLIKVVDANSKWHLVYNHPGGFENLVTIEMVSKNNWKSMKEKGGETEAKLDAVLKGIEVGLSAKAFTKVTRTDEFECQITEKSQRTFKDVCYIWQEIVVIKTNQEPPFDELRIPTPHVEQTSTQTQPKDKFIYDIK